MANPQQFCTFYLEKYLFGVELLKVQEVLQHLELSDVPLAPFTVRALMNLRGQIVIAIDLRRCCSSPSDPPAKGHHACVVRTGDDAVSLLVDEIGDVVEVNEEVFRGPSRDPSWRGAVFDPRRAQAGKTADARAGCGAGVHGGGRKMKLTLGKELGLGFGTILLLMLVSAGMSYIKLADIREAQQNILEVRAPTIEACRDLQSHLQEAASDARQGILAGENRRDARWPPRVLHRRGRALRRTAARCRNFRRDGTRRKIASA